MSKPGMLGGEQPRVQRADQEAEVGAALGERRHRDAEPGEPREQVVAERCVGDHVVEIAVRRGDDAQIDRRPRACRRPA